MLACRFPRIDETRPLKPAVLIATVHDPQARLLAATQRHRQVLASYAAAYFRCTPSTDKRVLDALMDAGHVSVGEPDRIGQSRRDVLRLAREAGAEVLFYCDFDRWLHWAGSFPQELRELASAVARESPGASYLCLGRTERAFATHPRVQRETEARSNRCISLLVGTALDATAGACWLDAWAADLILAASVETSNATDLEWPALIAKAAPGQLAAIAVEGLEFETATFHQPEIRAAGGLEAWIEQNYQGPEIWETRLELMRQSIGAALRVYGPDAMNALSRDDQAELRSLME